MLPQALKDRLEELRGAAAPTGRAVATGVAEMDAVLPGGGLGCGKVHEWLGLAGEEVRPGGRGAGWSPPLTLLTELSRRAAGSDGRIAWVGVWPYAIALAKAGVALSRCLMVRAAPAADRLWAIDLALRSRAAAVVVANGSRFDLSATRRLQLAAEAGGGMCLLARPAWEVKELSASATRWRVECAPSPAMNRRWKVQLLRCKGMRPGGEREWVVEREACAFRVVADLRDRPGEAAARGERLTA